MLTALVVPLRTLALCCQGHRAIALENLALRQQLAVFKRTVKRPPLRSRDRLFWMLLAPEGLPFHGEPATLIVREAKALGTVCRAADSVLLEQVLDDVLLLSIDPSGEEQEQKGERGRQPIHERQCAPDRVGFQWWRVMRPHCDRIHEGEASSDAGRL